MDNVRIKDSPIFIVGVPRSGTTLLRMILNAHSKIGIATETHFLRIFWSARSKYNDLLTEDGMSAFWEDLSGSKYFDDLNFNDTEEIRQKIFEGNRNFKDIFKTLMKEYACQRGKIRWGEKTPGHLMYSNVLLDFFPDCRIIHVIRDPRDVCLSFKKIPWGSNYAFSNARLWNRFIDFSRQQWLYSKFSYIEIRYEDLVSRPKESIEVLCRFIGVAPEDQMLSFHQYSDDYLEKNEPWKNGCFNPLTEKNIGKWELELTSWEIEQINLKCEKNMVEKGYLENSWKNGPFSYLKKILEKVVIHTIWFVRAFAINTVNYHSMASPSVKKNNS